MFAWMVAAFALLVPASAHAQSACSTHAECTGESEYCIDGRCEIGVVTGRCTASGSCRVGVCTDDARGGVCIGRVAAIRCSTHSDCDDGRFCDGVATCLDGFCYPGPPPCEGADVVCIESDDACVRSCSIDADADGVVSIACGGVDCDDNDPRRYPERLEVCDPLGHDEDCDPSTIGVLDRDDDGHVSSACFNTREDGERVRGPDCDDADPTTFGAVARAPGAPERCNGRDDDCDGEVDEELQSAPLVCDPDDETRVRVCTFEDGKSRIASLPCPGGTTCLSQPDGSGVCVPDCLCSEAPDDDLDRDGVPGYADLCPHTSALPVDQNGCSRAEFCAGFGRRNACARADFLGDGGRDCAFTPERGCVAR